MTVTMSLVIYFFFQIETEIRNITMYVDIRSMNDDTE